MLTRLPPSSDVVPGLHADQSSVEQRPGSQGAALKTELLRLAAQHQHPHGQQERSVWIHVRLQEIKIDESKCKSHIQNASALCPEKPRVINIGIYFLLTLEEVLRSSA